MRPLSPAEDALDHVLYGGDERGDDVRDDADNAAGAAARARDGLGLRAGVASSVEHDLGGIGARAGRETGGGSCHRTGHGALQRRGLAAGAAPDRRTAVIIAPGKDRICKRVTGRVGVVPDVGIAADAGVGRIALYRAARRGDRRRVAVLVSLHRDREGDRRKNGARRQTDLCHTLRLDHARAVGHDAAIYWHMGA